MTTEPLTGAGRPVASARARRILLAPRLARWALVVAVLVVLELLTRAELIGPLILPPPTTIVDTLISSVTTAQFRADLARTALTVAIAAACGIAAGGLLGALLWRIRLLGQALEPYLIALYAMPTIVFYPILISALGLGIGPVAVIAGLMALIPVTINVRLALQSVSAVLPKLGRSLNVSRLRMWRSIMLPAATPLAFTGVRLGFVYATIGTVAMEFILSNAGLGFRIAVDYRNFDGAHMWAMIVAVAILAMIVNWVLVGIERGIRRDML
jgi:NitT/TauT family transport system permease protein